MTISSLDKYPTGFCVHDRAKGDDLLLWKYIHTLTPKGEFFIYTFLCW